MPRPIVLPGLPAGTFGTRIGQSRTRPKWLLRNRQLNNLFKNLAIWMVIGVVLMTVFNQFNTRQVAPSTMEYSQFLEEAKAGRITKATVDGRLLRAVTQEGRSITVYTPGVQDIWMVSDLMRYGVQINATKPEEEQSFLASIFVSWFPMLLLIAEGVFFMRQM